MRDYRAKLMSKNAELRAAAAAILIDSFEDEDGAQLVDAMLNETDSVAFASISRGVMGKWSIKMEASLSQLDDWPLAPNCTVLFAIQARSRTYPSYQRFLLQHIKSDDWLYKCAAVIYSRDHGLHFGLLPGACGELLTTFRVDDGAWDAVAIPAGLTSKRRLRQKIERVAREITPPDTPSVWLPSIQEMSSVRLRHTDRNYRADLISDISQLRRLGASMLRKSYNDRDGDLLVSAMLSESHCVTFRSISEVVMGKWPVKMEYVLNGLAQWPIASNCTVWFALKARSLRYPSYERFLIHHIQSEEWLYKYAAVVYSRDHGINDGLICEACEELLSVMEHEDRDWDAVAVSTGLRSKRRLRRKIERISRELRCVISP